FSYSSADGVPVHVVQLTFLKLLSATARQSFTYHCLNSAGWLDTAAVGYGRALRFRASSGEELTHENAHYIDATYDGCQVCSGGGGGPAGGGGVGAWTRTDTELLV
ncbi:hypothetical protein CRUP_014840, partial [Coryphaenoides rupestris]